MYRPSKTLLWEMVPNQKAHHIMGGDVYVNSHGLRDEEFHTLKNGPEIRILNLGDSVTAGQQVEYEQTFTQILESLLSYDNTRYKIQVINAGVSGYNLYQEAAYLNEKGLNFEPDIVVISWVRNDWTEPYEGKDLAEIQGMSKRTIKRFNRALRKIALYHLFQEVMASRHRIRRLLGLRSQVNNTGLRVKNTHNNDSNRYQPTERDLNIGLNIDRTLGKIKTLCKSKNIELILVIFPTQGEVNQDDLRQVTFGKYVRDQLTFFAHQNQIKVLDPLSTMQENRNLRIFHLYDEVHLSVDGHSIIANYLFNEISPHIKRILVEKYL